MDLEQIRAFINVAVLKSFSDAAEKMYISQPSVSVRIKSLEEELGVILFDRSKAREPHLTEAGRIFFDYAQAIVNLQDECREKLAGEAIETTGLIHLGASTVPGIYLLPELLSQFREKATAINYNVEILDTSAVLEGVLNYAYDLGFVGLVKEDDRLVFLPLVEDELVYCCRKGNLPQHYLEQGLPLEELLKRKLILREKGSATRQLLEKRIVEQGLEPDSMGVTCINSLEGIKQAIISGLGCSVLSKLSITDMINVDKLDYCTIKGLELRRYLYLVHHRNRILGSAVTKFKEFVMQNYN